MENNQLRRVNIEHPHEIWPPAASQEELNDLIVQRNLDIGIKGKTGPIEKFENAFLDFLENKAKFSLSFNSGTSGLFAAYFAIGIEEGDEVIGPALTYHAALSPVYILKGSVVLCDIDEKTRCIDARKIEKLITKKTKAITVVHQWGHPAEMDTILSLAKKYNLYVIEDCSHAHGSKYKGRVCGTMGDVGVFSLQTNKAIFAGEGGILVTNKTKLYERATLLGHYRDRCKEEIKDPKLNTLWPTGFGLKLRLSPFNAIVAYHSLINFPEIKRNRHKCLNYFNSMIQKKLKSIIPHFVDDNVEMGAWYGMKPLYNQSVFPQLGRDKFIKIMNDCGIEVSAPSGGVLSKMPLYSSTTSIPYMSNFVQISNLFADVPVAKDVESRAFSFPTFYNFEKDKETIDQYINVIMDIETKISKGEQNVLEY